MLKKVLVATAAVVLSIAVSGCGPTPKEKAADANAKIAKMNEIETELARKVVCVRYTSCESVSSKEMDSMSDQRLADTIAALDKYAELGNHVISVADDDHIKFEGDLDAFKKRVKRATEIAQEGRDIQKERARKKRRDQG